MGSRYPGKRMGVVRNPAPGKDAGGRTVASNTFTYPLCHCVVNCCRRQWGLGVSLVVGAPVRGIDQQGDSREDLRGVGQRIYQKKGVEVHEQVRVEVQELRSKPLHHRAPRVMLNCVLCVGHSAQEARSTVLLKTTGRRPSIPHRAEDRRLYPWSHQLVQLPEVMKSCPAMPILRALSDWKQASDVSVVGQVEVPASVFVPDAVFGWRSARL